MAIRSPIRFAGARHERVSIVFTPAATSDAHGCQRVIAFNLGSCGFCDAFPDVLGYLWDYGVPEGFEGATHQCCGNPISHSIHLGFR